MSRIALLPLLALLLPLAVACETTKSSTRAEQNENGEVTVTPDELEPVRTFLLETRRVLMADFVRIRCTPQYFEQQMGMVRDQQSVARSMARLEDGTRVITLSNKLLGQRTNFDKNRLPRVYFGQSGLEIIATRQIRVYFVRPDSTDRPLFIDITGKSGGADAQLWSSGRLQIQKPTIHIRSALIWSEAFSTYKHKSSVG